MQFIIKNILVSTPIVPAPTSSSIIIPSFALIHSLDLSRLNKTSQPILSIKY